MNRTVPIIHIPIWHEIYSWICCVIQNYISIKTLNLCSWLKIPLPNLKIATFKIQNTWKINKFQVVFLIKNANLEKIFKVWKNENYHSDQALAVKLLHFYWVCFSRFCLDKRTPPFKTPVSPSPPCFTIFTCGSAEAD